MSAWSRCVCKGSWEEKRKHWVVRHRNHNHSYFETPKGAEHFSLYSCVSCLRCYGMFRTKASYVYSLPDAKNNE